MHFPRKRFGQHFLENKSIIEKIVQAINPKQNQHLIEIGPGQGAITFEILNITRQLTVIELDRDLIPELKTKSSAIGKLDIYQADVLKFDFHQLNQSHLRILGNLPYNISTPLLFHLIDYLDEIQDMHFMLQKEVAERIAAKSGSKDYGPLSVILQYFCEAEMLFFIPPTAFYPPPKVESAFIRLTPKSPLLKANSLKNFKEIVHLAFNQRRKMLRNSLKKVMTENEIMSLNIDPQSRPEVLSVQDFVRISNFFISSVSTE